MDDEFESSIQQLYYVSILALSLLIDAEEVPWPRPAPACLACESESRERQDSPSNSTAMSPTNTDFNDRQIWAEDCHSHRYGWGHSMYDVALTIFV